MEVSDSERETTTTGRNLYLSRSRKVPEKRLLCTYRITGKTQESSTSSTSIDPSSVNGDDALASGPHLLKVHLNLVLVANLPLGIKRPCGRMS